VKIPPVNIKLRVWRKKEKVEMIFNKLNKKMVKVDVRCDDILQGI